MLNETNNFLMADMYMDCMCDLLYIEELEDATEYFQNEFSYALSVGLIA